MKIGITYDLRQDYLDLGYGEEETAEFDRPDTIDAVERALRALGHRTDRIGNVQALTRRLAAGDRWDLVFNIAEGLNGIGREAQVPALLDAWGIPYTFSDPLVLSLTLHKGMTKRVVRDLGIPTPDFAEVREIGDVEAVDLPYPLFAKPVAEGTGKGIDGASMIADPARLREVCARLLRDYRQPVLVETFLPGREFTVGIAGTGAKARAVGTIEVVLGENAERHAYSYENKERCEELVEYVLVDDDESHRAEATALRAWRGLGCRDAGRVDLRSDASGTPCFIEVNPLAGIHPEHSDLPIICAKRGIPYARLFEWIIESASERITSGGPPPETLTGRTGSGEDRDRS
ncbi:MAG: D-alanine--D-alanine ligase [Candidatus Krumholzibacteria bacterium]|nr:D-alanine--D-alanine ligase [Candidatus Krumholzibacteria bacterium]